jgi:hypothetical protein
MSRAGLLSALDQLYKYSRLHFALEEKIAKAVGYPELGGLHSSHEDLLKTLGQISVEIGEQWDAAAAEHFGKFLREWLISHVIEHAAQAYLKSSRPALIRGFSDRCAATRAVVCAQGVGAVFAAENPQKQRPVVTTPHHSAKAVSHDGRGAAAIRHCAARHTGPRWRGVSADFRHADGGFPAPAVQNPALGAAAASIPRPHRPHRNK